MIRQHDNGIDNESVAATRSLDRIAQSIDAIDKQGVSTLKKIDRKEPAPPGYECATVIGHPYTLAQYGGLRFANPPYDLSIAPYAEHHSPPALLACLQALAVRTETLLDESKSLGAEVRDFRLGLEISVIQAFADRIVGMLKVRDPLSERVHLSPLELLAQSFGGIASEITRRAVGRRPVSNPAAGA